MTTANIKPSRTKVGQPTVSLCCSPCNKAGKITKLSEATAKFIDGVSHCTECWSAYGDRLVETEPGSRRYTLRQPLDEEKYVWESWGGGLIAALGSKQE